MSDRTVHSKRAERVVAWPPGLGDDRGRACWVDRVHRSVAINLSRTPFGFRDGVPEDDVCVAWDRQDVTTKAHLLTQDEARRIAVHAALLAEDRPDDLRDAARRLT